MKGSAAVGLFLALSLPLMVGAQVADTVFVTVEGDLSSVTITQFEATFRIGDTVQFVAEARDSEGDPVSAAFTWSSGDTTVVRIDALTGLAVGVGKGSNVAIWIRAEPISEMHVASFRPPDSLNWSGIDTIFRPVDSLGNLIGEPPTLQHCAYVVDAGGYLVMESPGPPLCPVVFPIRPTQVHPMFAGVSRSRPFEFIEQMRAVLGQG